MSSVDPNDIEKGVYLKYKDGQDLDETEIFFKCGTEVGDLEFDGYKNYTYKFKFETKYACADPKSVGGRATPFFGGLFMFM